MFGIILCICIAVIERFSADPDDWTGPPRFITLRVSPNRGNTQNAHPLGYWRCLYGVGMVQIDVLHHPVSTIGMPSTLRQMVIEFRPKICPCRRFGRFFDQNVVRVESIANISPMVIAGK